MASKVLMALLSRDYQRAADLYYQQGRLDKALEMYERAGQLAQAARLATELGDLPRAADLLVRAGQVRQAGELFASHGRAKEAIPLLERAGAFWAAAEASQAIQQPARAARYYERAQAWAPAARNYEKANLLEDAARVLELEVHRLREQAAGDPAHAEPMRQAAVRRADLLVRLGRAADAARQLQAVGLAAKAAPLFEKAREWRAALEAYVAVDELEAAARLLDRVPVEPELAARIHLRGGRGREAGDLLARAGRAAEAAEAYEHSGETLAAAEQWEAAGDPARAAEAYEAAGRFADAGRCHAAAGNQAAAAEAFVHGGEPREAANLFARLGQPLKAAKLFLEAGDRAGAIAALQRVPDGSPGFERATLALVPLLLEDGLPEAALHRLEMLPADGRLTTTGALDRVYWEGRVLEALGRGGEAATVYEKLLALRRDHRDAAARLASVRTGSRRVAPTTDTQPVVLAPDATPTPSTASGSLPTGAALGVGSLLAGRYEILGELGRGGMGRVYRARDRELGEVVAIKTLLRTGREETGDEDRLIREVQICRRITHPNVVRVYDIGRFEGGIFVTMELVEGTRLDVLLQQAGPLPLDRVRSILLDVAAGLREAHALDIVHRDLKPGNVIVTPTRLKILDFGIARGPGADTRLTQTGEAMGSPMYMSPEQVQGLPLDGRSDLYALGVLVFTLLAGREPFTGSTAAMLALAHLQSPPPDLRTLRPDLPEAWAEMVERLLAKRPEDRYATAAELQEAALRLPVAV